MAKGKPEPEVRYRRYLEAEQEAVVLYTAMAEAEEQPERAQIFRELADSERRHVAYWAGKLGLSIDEVSALRPTFRVRLLGWLARRFGTRRVLPIVLRIEAEDTVMYAGDPEANAVMEEGEEHSQVLRGLRDRRQPGIELEGGGWQRAMAGGTLRAAVLGGNDGLVSNFSLVWGVAGGTSDPQIVLLAGVAGLLAGSFSMAAGEYVSMRAHRELSEHRIEMERKEIEEIPEEERAELSLIYRLKGLDKKEADFLAERIMRNPDVALETMVREELGLDPGQLGSPWGATISSFVSFAMGAIIPVLPYALGGDQAFIVSGALSAVALLVVGMVLSLVSRRTVLWGGLRMLLIGMAAAGVTFGVGRLIGVSLS
ncbi:MAG: VIT1/CCC1 transporter family protein [Dehalococcoidia bacterium]